MRVKMLETSRASMGVLVADAAGVLAITVVGWIAYVLMGVC